jgi:hypothetical protein
VRGLLRSRRADRGDLPIPAGILLLEARLSQLPRQLDSAVRRHVGDRDQGVQQHVQPVVEAALDRVPEQVRQQKATGEHGGGDP